MADSANPSIRALQMELKNLEKQPVEGFRVSLKEETNLYEWNVAIFGAPGTLYQGGYFKALLNFPQDYPYSPPTMKFPLQGLAPKRLREREPLHLHPPSTRRRSSER